MLRGHAESSGTQTVDEGKGHDMKELGCSVKGSEITDKGVEDDSV